MFNQSTQLVQINRALAQLKESSDSINNALTELQDIGRGHDRVVSALVDLVKDTSKSLPNRIHGLEALAAMSTPLSSSSFARLVPELIATQEETLLCAIGDIVQKHPRSFVPWLNHLHKACLDVRGSAHSALSNGCESVMHQGRSDFERFCRENRIEPGRIALADAEVADAQLSRIGELSVKSDCVVTYGSTIDIKQTASPLYARVVVLSQEECDFLVIAVCDIHTSPSLTETFEQFATYMHDALIATASIPPDSKPRFGIFQPHTRSQPQGEFTEVVVSDVKDNCSITRQEVDSILDEWSGDNSAALREYLSTSKPLSNAFCTYLQGLIEDDVIAQRYQRQKNKSGGTETPDVDG